VGPCVGLVVRGFGRGAAVPAPGEGGSASVGAGLAIGVVFLLGSRRRLQGRDVHVGELRGAGVTRSLLVFGAQSARGVRDRHATPGLALFVILAIGLQNVAEGTSVAIPMDGAGFTRAQQFWAAVLTSAAQPLGAVAAYLAVEQVSGLLPFSFAFAAGAMLSPVMVELSPQAFQARRANRGRGRWWDSPRSSAWSEAMLGEAVGRCGALRVEGIRSNERGSP
jgi:zinc transporter, ZIP family